MKNAAQNSKRGHNGMQSMKHGCLFFQEIAPFTQTQADQHKYQLLNGQLLIRNTAEIICIYSVVLKQPTSNSSNSQEINSTAPWAVSSKS